jgi:hypothetical protein
VVLTGISDLAKTEYWGSGMVPGSSWETCRSSLIPGECAALASMAGELSMLFPEGEDLFARIRCRANANPGGLFGRVEQGAMSARHPARRGCSKKFLRWRRGSFKYQISSRTVRHRLP